MRYPFETILYTIEQLTTKTDPYLFTNQFEIRDAFIARLLRIEESLYFQGITFSTADEVAEPWHLL